MQEKSRSPQEPYKSSHQSSDTTSAEFLVPLTELSKIWNDVFLTKVELSMTYKCEDQLSRQTLLRYIHQNRNYNSLKINTMGAKI